MLKNIIGTGLPVIEYSRELFIPRIFKKYLQNNEKKLP